MTPLGLVLILAGIVTFLAAVRGETLASVIGPTLNRKKAPR